MLLQWTLPAELTTPHSAQCSAPNGRGPQSSAAADWFQLVRVESALGVFIKMSDNDDIDLTGTVDDLLGLGENGSEAVGHQSKVKRRRLTNQTRSQFLPHQNAIDGKPRKLPLRWGDRGNASDEVPAIFSHCDDAVSPPLPRNMVET